MVGAEVPLHRPSEVLLSLVPALPLLGAAVLLLTGSRWRGRSAGWLGTGLVASSFALSVVVVAQLLANPVEARTFTVSLFEWVAAGRFSVPVSLRLDPLSAVMALTVSGVGALIHLYSVEYMARDPRYPRFFGFMNLFVFFMLTLVLADNFLLLYLGWEGVGLCSYLLIGFWFERPAAASAAKKAFVTTRIGDSAFLIGLVLLWLRVGSLEFDAVFASAQGLAAGTATVLALLLFAGAVGKSAQVPLHVWLPDAMEGPTPVSALIHAATMVTAGVYLVVRSHPLFETSGVALTVVAVVGAVTAVYAGLSAIGQDDIKRMLAYSTMSTLGFMFLGAGVGAYAAAIFLLVTHAFFKALLFLGAGSVMHGLGDETDMVRMGGLRRAMPWTFATWVVGWLAMAGVPPLSGFFSKDQVVAATAEAGRTGLWVLALVGTFLTAVYITRGSLIVFFGRPRHAGHPHEAPPLMRAALLALAVGAAAGGVLGLSATTGVLPRLLEPVVGGGAEAHARPSEAVLMAVSIAVTLAGIALAWFVYLSGRIDWLALRARLWGLKQALLRGFYVDDLYAGALVAPAKLAAAFAAYVVDRRVIDGAVEGLGTLVARLAAAGRRVQTGLVRVYALAFLLGAVGVLSYLVARA
ncbi:MAG TPA: NADH-quinone oxidoreductase subunit L [Actinomycetota bacterium]|nr:NADH-quinone oxidoreductase subunit L [Actinomycetota bacterium]